MKVRKIHSVPDVSEFIDSRAKRLLLSASLKMPFFSASLHLRLPWASCDASDNIIALPLLVANILILVYRRPAARNENSKGKRGAMRSMSNISVGDAERRCEASRR